MASEVHVDGISNFDKALEDLKIKVEGASKSFVMLGGQVIADKAKAEFVGGTMPPPWQGPNFPHPTMHSGFLRNSIRVDAVVKTGAGWMSTTGPHSVYGRRIELGYTGTGSFPYYTTRPFPYLKPGLEKSKSALEDLFQRLVTTAQEA